MKYLFIVLVTLASVTVTVSAHAEASAKVKVVTVAGKAEYSTPGSKQRLSLTPGTLLAPGSVIYTGSNGVVQVRTYPGSAFRLVGSSTLKLIDLQVETKGNELTTRKAVLDLQKGALVTCLTDKFGTNQTLEVRTPYGTTVAHGARFAVVNGLDSKRDHRTYVGLKRGQVQCRARYIRITSGDSAA